MTVLTYTTSTQPSVSGVVTITSIYTNYKLYNTSPRAQFQAGDTLGGSVNQAGAVQSLLSGAFNGGTFGPAKGGSAVQSNITFVWGPITSG
jgi:hypothetical protein